MLNRPITDLGIEVSFVAHLGFGYPRVREHAAPNGAAYSTQE